MSSEQTTSEAKQVFVVCADDGRSLACFVAERAGLGQQAAIQRLRAGSVFVDGRRQKGSRFRLRPGQQVVVHAPLEVKGAAGVVVYRDQEVAVVDKAAGVPSMLPRRGATVTVEGFISDQLGSRARLMHRLDQGASGLLLVSCRKRTRAALAKQIANRECTRRYLALVAGAPLQQRWLMCGALLFDGRIARLSSASNARPAETEALMLTALEGNRSLVQLELRTGRTHQIRAHLAAEGLPIIGDERYGGPSAARLALHAHQLSLRHSDGRLLDLHRPLPADFRALLGRT